MLEYRSVQDLNNLIVKNLDKFDSDLDLIVGNLRSGMLPATLISLYLNLPLIDLIGYLNGNPPEGGKRLRDKQDRSGGADTADRPRKVLVVDDSLMSGNAMSALKERIRQANVLNDRIQYCAIYVHPDRRSHVDIWLEAPMSRVFEWNILAHPTLKQACVDIDGFLCRDPTPEENDDGPQYKAFIESVKPLYQPLYKFGWVVTSRLEKYRWATAQWLKTHQIEYDYLIMLNLPSKEGRVAKGCHAQFKADVYAETDSMLFIESSEIQASQIAKFSRKPVFCTETRKMYYHTSPDIVKRREANLHFIREKVIAKLPKSFTKKIKNLLKKMRL